MTFVNEYVSEEDIKEYGLEEIFLNYHPTLKASGLPTGFRFKWVIDRESNRYFFQIGGFGGHPDYGIRYILNLSGKEFLIRLRMLGEGSKSYNEDPYIIVWDLLQVKPEKDELITPQEIIQILKEALTTFGIDGISYQLPNTIVKFKF